MISFSNVAAIFGIVFAVLAALSLACILALGYGVTRLPAKPEQKLAWTVALRGAEKSFMIFAVATIVTVLASAFARSAA